MSRYRLSLDVGGTCTDVVASDEETGTYATGKAAPTPVGLTEGVPAGLHPVTGSAVEIGFTVHGASPRGLRRRKRSSARAWSSTPSRRRSSEAPVSLAARKRSGAACSRCS